MPHRHIEYGVLYYIDRGPTRESIYDAARLGYYHEFRIQFELRGEQRDFILGDVKASVEGVNRAGSGYGMLFLTGQLDTYRDSGGHPLEEIWRTAHYFAQYNLKTHRGRILFNNVSFIQNPLKEFGPYKEVKPEL